MSSSNSKNFTYMIVLGLIVFVTFTYIVISNNVDNTINTDVGEVELDEE